MDIVWECSAGRGLLFLIYDQKTVVSVCNGDVIEAVIYLENKKNTCNCKAKSAKETMEEVFGKDDIIKIF